MTTFPLTGIATCPRNTQPQMLLCEKSNSFQRHQDLSWNRWTQTSPSKDQMSHQMSFTSWNSEMLYPDISGGTRFACTNSFSLVKSRQFSGKNSMTTLILHACKSTKTDVYIPHKNNTRKERTTILSGWSLSYLHGSPQKKHSVAIL